MTPNKTAFTTWTYKGTNWTKRGKIIRWITSVIKQLSLSTPSNSVCCTAFFPRQDLNCPVASYCFSVLRTLKKNMQIFQKKWEYAFFLPPSWKTGAHQVKIVLCRIFRWNSVHGLHCSSWKWFSNRKKKNKRQPAQKMQSNYSQCEIKCIIHLKWMTYIWILK